MADNETTQESGAAPRNALAVASSAYLRSASRQPVAWTEWGEAAFERAASEDKPVLLDIGAVWCHWCHVMDRESYEDLRTARLINENFVAVKVDRDERPDVDARYQAAVAAISGQGGWPLTAFLTPEGKPYFGGTYFPREDRHGRPGFQRVLITMADAFANRRAEINESADSVMEAIEQNEAFSGRYAELTQELVEKMVLAMLKTADLRHGGFGSQPKFPHSSALNLLLDVAQRAHSATDLAAPQALPTVQESARHVVSLTLQKMAAGGICDHLAGGFHRYSVDERWVVPHFEKLAYDNSELLKNYVHAFQSFGEPEFSRVARDIMRWMNECLTDQAAGGFYASQDADHSVDDDGDYFTWTRDEAAEVLTPQELKIAAEYFDIAEIGEMHHNPAKNVLHIKHSLEAVARKADIPADQARRLLQSAKQRMYAARLRRPAPYVDKTMYVGWNAMCISSYLLAGRVLEDAASVAFALRTLDALLQHVETRGMTHVWRYGDEQGRSETTAALLDDHVFLGHAALDAWEATGSLRYYEAAERIAENVGKNFFDPEHSGFFDLPIPQPGELRLGALAARRKPLQDSPTPAANPVAAILLLRLSELNGRSDFAEKAARSLETFAGVAEHFGLYAATYASAIQRFLHGGLGVCIVGSDESARVLERAALRRYAVKSVIRIPALAGSNLPPGLASRLRPAQDADGSYALVLRGGASAAVVRSADELLAAIAG